MWKKRIKSRIVGIDVWKGKAYIPTIAKSTSGLYVDIEPVYVTSLKIEDIVKAIHTVMKSGHKIISDPRFNVDSDGSTDPILKVTGNRNWKQLAKNGAGYTIAWSEEKKEVRIDMTILNKKGIWEYDLKKKKILPSNTSLDDIVRIILADVFTRPEILV